MAAMLTTLKRDLGKERIGHLDRSRLIDYGTMRADQGAGPVTLGIDIGVIKMIITHAAAVHGPRHLARTRRSGTGRAQAPRFDRQGHRARPSPDDG